jgi:hypothetical protein
LVFRAEGAQNRDVDGARHSRLAPSQNGNSADEAEAPSASVENLLKVAGRI